MSDDREIDDFAVVRLLREQYAEPAAPEYWTGLESAIMKRVRGAGAEGAAPVGTLDLLAGWSRTGLIAAGIAGLIAGLAVSRVRQAEASVPYEVVFRETSPAVSMQIPEESSSSRDAMLRYLITP